MASRKPSLIVVPQQPVSCPPDPEVLPKASRRTFSAAEKLRILNEADACTQPGQIGALLRREGLYSSHLVKWRRLRAAGQLQALAPQPRGPKPTPADPLADQLAQLRSENARLQARLAQAELIIDVQKKSSAAAWGDSPRTALGRAIIMEAVDELATAVGVAEACRVLGVPRSSHYRARQTPEAAPPVPLERPVPARALSAEERTAVRDVLNSERFQDCAVREVYATLLDEAIYLCSWRTMYRILAAADEVRERRDQLRRPTYTKPELLATRPRELWSWDITKLKGPTKWTYYYLYVILDVFSRYVVGYMISERESAELAEAFIAETCAKEGICPDQLTLHADRGSAMTSKTVAQLLADLGVTKTHSRPHVSNDNPYSESQFKTLKYRPDFPTQFGSLADARAWARPFFQWYNQEHHHSGIGLLTPATVHCGQAAETLAARQEILLAAYHAHPERFVRGMPKAPVLPTAVWINPAPVPEPGVEQLSVERDQPQGSMANASQPIVLKFRPDLSQTA